MEVQYILEEGSTSPGLKKASAELQLAIRNEETYVSYQPYFGAVAPLPFFGVPSLTALEATFLV